MSRCWSHHTNKHTVSRLICIGDVSHSPIWFNWIYQVSGVPANIYIALAGMVSLKHGILDNCSRSPSPGFPGILGLVSPSLLMYLTADMLSTFRRTQHSILCFVQHFTANDHTSNSKQLEADVPGCTKSFSMTEIYIWSSSLIYWHWTLKQRMLITFLRQSSVFRMLIIKPKFWRAFIARDARVIRDWQFCSLNTAFSK